MLAEPVAQDVNVSNVTSSQQGTLRRLLRERDAESQTVGQSPPLPLPETSSPAQAAGTALLRTGNALLDLPIKVDHTTIGAATLAELAEHIKEDCLLVILQGDGEALGVMALNLAAVVSLIEMQTLGRVTSRQLHRRVFTKGDALMCAEFVNALTEALGNELANQPEFAGIAEFRYASFLTETRPLLLILDDCSYRSMSFAMHLGRGAGRAAEIFLAVPAPPVSAGADPAASGNPHVSPPSDTSPQTGQLRRSGAGRGPSLKAAVQQAEVEVSAVLCRQKITLRQLRNLTIGQEFVLMNADLTRINLELKDGTLLSTGKLGVLEGCHAIRIQDPADTGLSGGQQDHAFTTADADAFALADPLPVDLDAPDPLRDAPEDLSDADPSEGFVTDETQFGAA